MKKIMKLFVLVAAAAMALASCQTQEMEDPTPTPKEYEYIFNIGNADEEDAPETSATLGYSCVEWETGDQIGVYTDGQNGVSYNRYGNVTLGSPVTFTISSYYALVAGDMVHCYYPYVKTNSQDPKTVELSIPTSQTEKNQMPMVSLPYAVTEDLAEKTNSDKSSGEINFANLGSVIEFLVYSTTAAYQTELIKSVTFNADKAIAGDFVFDLTAVDYSDEKTLAISDYEATSVVSTLSVPVAVPATKGEAKVVKMVVAPGSYTGNVVVTTNKATYTYPISSAKEFNRSAVKSFGLDLRENVRQADVWSLVTSVDNMPDGEYVILAKRDGDEGYGYLPSATSTSASPVYNTQSAFDCVSSVVAEPAVTSDMIWNFARNEGGWTITNVDGKYLYSNDSTTGLRVGATSETWSISVNSPAFSMREESRFIGAYKDKEEWRTYTTPNHDNYGTAGGKLYFYYHGKLEAIPAISVSDVTGVSARGVEGATLTFTIVNPDGSDVSVNCDGVVVTQASVDGTTVTYTVAENMTDEQKSGSLTFTYGAVEKVVTVAQNAAKFSSTQSEIVLGADEGANKSMTINSDFDWTSTIDGEGFSVSPESYTWSEGGSRSVTVRASAANTSEEGTITLGTVTFTSATGQELVVTVKQESSYVDTSVSTATLTFDDTAKRTSFSATQQVWEENGITFTNDKTSESSNVADYANPVRCYKNSSITVEMAATMSVIEFTCGSPSYATALKNSIGNDATLNGSVVTVNLANPSTSFNVAKLTDQVQLKSITVTYTDGTSGGETPDPTPDPGEGGESVTVLNTIEQIASSNSWANGTKYPSFRLDDIITATVAGGGNTGKYYTSGHEWRIYQTETPTLTITAAEGYTIETVKITYKYSNAGVLTLGTSNIASNTTVSVNAASVVFGVGNTGSATNGQVKVTQIEVVYHADN